MQGGAVGAGAARVRQARTGGRRGRRISGGPLRGSAPGRAGGGCRRSSPGKRAAAEAGLPCAVSLREADDLLHDAETFLSLAENTLGVPGQTLLPLRTAGEAIPGGRGTAGGGPAGPERSAGV